MRDVLWAPNPGPQTEFLASTAREVLFGGAVGGGKSEALKVMPLRWADHPKLRAIYLRRHKDDCREMIDRVRELYPRVLDLHPQHGWHETEFRFRFPAGGFLQFGYAHHEKDIEQYKCLTADHDVLTRDRGWVPIADIEAGEHVASWWEGRLTWERVAATYCYDFDGQLTTSNGNVSFRVTPNHKFRVRSQHRPSDRQPVPWRWKQASELKAGNVVPTGGRGLAPTRCTFSGDELELWGWWLAEGAAADGKAPGEKERSWRTTDNRRVQIHQHDARGLARIEALCTRLGLRYTRHEKLITVWWVPPLDSGSNSYDKHIPRELLDEQHRARLLLGLLQGDGSKQSNSNGSRWVYGSSSKQLAEDVQELATRIGRRARLREMETSHAPHWQVYITRRQAAALYALEAERYTGKVYCLAVPPSSTFLVRHNGNPHITGNTNEYNLILFDELTEFTRWQYLFMFTRNRSKADDLPTYIRSATNPGGEGMQWVDERFLGTRMDGTQKYKPYQVYEHKQSVEGLGRVSTTRQYIPSTVFDNPKLPNVEEYIAGLSHLPDAEREAMLYGRWGKFRGQYFKQAPELVDPGIKRGEHGSYYLVRCMDYGWSDPTAVLWLVVYENGVIEVAGELYETQMTTDNIVQLGEVVERELGAGTDGASKVRYSVLSPDAFNAGQDGEPSIAHNLSRAGWWFTRANNDRISGWHQIARLIEQGRLRVWRGRAPNLVRTLTKLPHDPRDPRDVKRTKVEDHAPEALRYGVMALAESSPGEDEPRGEKRNEANVDPYWDDFVEHLEDASQDRNRDFVPGLGYGW